MPSQLCQLGRLTTLLASVCVCTLTGCLGGGLYSVQHQGYGIGAGTDWSETDAEFYPEGEESIVGHGNDCQESECQPVSLTNAIIAACGPPEMFHEELMYGDPGAIVSPTPKYHPLPTRPVFQPHPNQPLPAAAPLPADPMLPTTTEKVTSTAEWRGPLPRMSKWQPSAPPRQRVAYNPLENIVFPPRPPEQLEPEILAPEEAHPLRR